MYLKSNLFFAGLFFCFLLQNQAIAKSDIAKTIVTKQIITNATMAKPAMAKPAIEYLVETTEPSHHLMQVSMVFDNLPNSNLVLHLPAWRTGKYQILNLAKDIRHFTAINQATGKVLKSSKLDKSSWQIQKNNASTIKVTYQVYANELGKRTKHLDDSHLFFDSASVLMYIDQYRDSSAIVSLKTPKGWSSYTGLELYQQKGSIKVDSNANNEQASDVQATYYAENYDVLIDSPIEAGTPIHRTFSVDKKDYELVIWGHGNYDIELMIADFKKIIKTTGSVWGEYPFARYVFMVHATDKARGATEHINSTIIQKPRYQFAKRKDYLGFIRTATHEFVHTWNVKQYRPSGLQRYDFQKENYTDLLWVAEGTTSYFDGLLTARAEVITPEEYLKSLAQMIDNYSHRPGAKTISAAEASWDAWILSESRDRSNNASVSIYSQGELLSWALDMKIREATKGKKGLENVHRRLFEEFRLPHKSYSNADLLKLINEVSGKDFTDWYQLHVQGTETIQFEPMLKSLGLEFSYKPSKGESGEKYWVGITMDSSGSKINKVEQGSPAWKSGLTLNDKIIAINGYELQQPFAAWLLANSTTMPLEITYFRRGRMHQTSVQPIKVANGKPQLKMTAKPSRKQKKMYRAWLGLPWNYKSE
jgi:predicted metalloprotease with PDZ domain